AWKEWAEMADTVPSRVEVQSYTFISPMGDTVRYLMHPADLSLVNFGICALTGVIVGSFLYALAKRSFRIEWFASAGDFVNHAVGAVLMGVGGVLGMGCTIGQGVTGVSTLAIGSMLTLVAIIAGAAGTMKLQYWRMMREA
ncbi:MAG TPA: YeeE/YedE thiosulfate transporter family protein, partial [Rhodocyclaceae bacterium]|nr:YeeE/YedE thiosulfate transporter family protein [Rhodocyclaceae bacterium]